MPRRSKKRARPPATAASTTSLTVPPKAFLTSLKSASWAETKSSRRCGVIGTFNGVSGALLIVVQAASATPSSASRLPPSRPPRAAPAAPAPARRPALTAEAPRRSGGLLPVARPERQPPGDVAEQLVAARRRALEGRDGADVHVGRRTLLMQKRRVDRSQPVHVALGHPSARLRDL